MEDGGDGETHLGFLGAETLELCAFRVGHRPRRRVPLPLRLRLPLLRLHGPLLRPHTRPSCPHPLSRRPPRISHSGSGSSNSHPPVRLRPVAVPSPAVLIERDRNGREVLLSLPFSRSLPESLSLSSSSTSHLRSHSPSSSSSPRPRSRAPTPRMRPTHRPLTRTRAPRKRIRVDEPGPSLRVERLARMRRRRGAVRLSLCHPRLRLCAPGGGPRRAEDPLLRAGAAEEVLR